MKSIIDRLTPKQKEILKCCLMCEGGERISVSLTDSGLCLVLKKITGETLCFADTHIDGVNVTALKSLQLIEGESNPHSHIYWHLTERGVQLATKLLNSVD